MSYTKVNWQNSPSHATPLSAENLNVMDEGIYDLDTAVGDLSDLETTTKTDLVSAINEVGSNTHITGTVLYFE